MSTNTQAVESTQQEQNFNAPAQTIGNGVELASTNVRDQFMQAMMPRTFDDVWRMSQMIAESDLAPKDYKGKPGNVMIAWQTGVELGITSPMQAIQNIAVINGRPTLWGDMMLAICRSVPAWSEADFQEWIEGEGMAMTAHCTVRRRPNGNVAHHTFSAQDAQDASLLNKQGPWQQYKKRMLQMRARSFALRDTFTPELKGIRMAEEERDITPEANTANPAPQAQGRSATAGKVGNKLAEKRQRQQQAQQAREVYETTAEEKTPEDSHGEITADMVCAQINKASTNDEMAEAIDLARHVPEADQAKVNATYKARIAELKQSTQ